MAGSWADARRGDSGANGRSVRAPRGAGARRRRGGAPGTRRRPNRASGRRQCGRAPDRVPSRRPRVRTSAARGAGPGTLVESRSVALPSPQEVRHARHAGPRPRAPGARRRLHRGDPANHLGAVTEPGCVRFDVLQAPDDPTRFVLYEAYRDAAAAAAHKETAHYLAWKAAVAGWMAEPRRGEPFTGLLPVLS